MNPEQFWQNFQLGTEHEIACNFIYDGLKNLHDMKTLSLETEVFPVLYTLSIGLERLLKVAVILLEFDAQTDVNAFEKSLLTHNHLELLNRIKARVPINPGGASIALLGLLSVFYKTHRYDRFNLQSIKDLSKDKIALHHFLRKYLGIDTKENIFGIENSLRVKRFMGRTVKKITTQLHAIIEDAARAKNLYTYEISGSTSKAAKILWGNDEIVFDDEERNAIEILIFLLKTKESSLMDFIRDMEPLSLDPALDSDYFHFLLGKRVGDFSGIADEIDAHYEEIDNPKERLEMIDAIRNPYLTFGSSEEEFVKTSLFAKLKAFGKRFINRIF